jgi:predicted TIM-barrel fold metal-dependent hydrolase
MKKLSIDKACLLPWESPREEYVAHTNYSIPDLGPWGPAPFARCLAYAERAPEKFWLGYAPDPRRQGALEQLQAAVEVYGVKIYGEMKLRMMYDSPDALRMFRLCGELGIPALLHIQYDLERDSDRGRTNWYGGGIEALERVLAACPDTNFLGHAMGFWVHLSGDDQYKRTDWPEGKIVPGGRIVQLLKTYPNLFCDLSSYFGHNALKRDPEFSREFLIEFQDRVLYGTDTTENVLQELLTSLELPEKVLEKIYSRNALRLLPGVTE